MRAVLLTEPGAQAVEVRPQKDDTLLWSKCKYRLCLACYPDHSSVDGVALYMRQRFCNPEACQESDLHPLVFPPPLSQIVVYGPALFVAMKNRAVAPLSLPRWKAAWQQMHTHAWLTEDALRPEGGVVEKSVEKEEEQEAYSSSTETSESDEESDEEMEEEDDGEDEDGDPQSSSDDEDDMRTTESDSDVEEEDAAEPVVDSFVTEEYPAPMAAEPRKRQKRYSTRSTLVLRSHAAAAPGGRQPGGRV